MKDEMEACVMATPTARFSFQVSKGGDAYQEVFSQRDDGFYFFGKKVDVTDTEAAVFIDWYTSRFKSVQKVKCLRCGGDLKFLLNSNGNRLNVEPCPICWGVAFDQGTANALRALR